MRRKLKTKRDAETRYRKSPKGRNTKLLRDFGITYQQYCNMLGEQSGRCAICNSVPSKRNLAVDHCHTTGKVRGLLCGSCNKGLGHFFDIPELLDLAADYLRRNGN